MSPAEIWEALAISRQGAMDLLRPLLVAGLVEKIGGKKTGRYSLKQPYTNRHSRTSHDLKIKTATDFFGNTLKIHVAAMRHRLTSAARSESKNATHRVRCFLESGQGVLLNFRKQKTSVENISSEVFQVIQCEDLRNESRGLLRRGWLRESLRTLSGGRGWLRGFHRW
jgi:hypothetical protein